MDLVKDWMAFCNGKLNVDKSHFLAIFQVESEKAVHADIFGFFPSADSLVERMEKFQLARQARNNGSI